MLRQTVQTMVLPCPVKEPAMMVTCSKTGWLHRLFHALDKTYGMHNPGNVYVCTLFFHVPMFLRSIDSYVESMIAKLIPHHCPCGISIAIFRITYMRHVQCH